MSATDWFRYLDLERLACPVPRSQSNRSFISTAISTAGVLLALTFLLSCQSKLDGGSAKARSSPESTDSPAADLIARVKDVSVSTLEKGLPALRFEDWVRANTGPDWNVKWGFTQGPRNPANHALDFPDSVDVRGDTKDGRYFRLSIGTTTNANQVLLFWLSGAANVQHKWVGLEHLSQLPRLLHQARKN